MSITEDQARDLAAAARDARKKAYAPYSGFDAGAAVLTSDGETHTGALVENLIFGLAMCAERVALFTSLTHGVAQPIAVALAAPETAGDPTKPCGPCLQVAAELGGSEMAVIVAHEGDGVEVTTVGALAPGIPTRSDPGAGRWSD